MSTGATPPLPARRNASLILLRLEGAALLSSESSVVVQFEAQRL